MSSTEEAVDGAQAPAAAGAPSTAAGGAPERLVRFSDRVLMVGKTKSGKTTLAMHMCREMYGHVRVFHFDPKRRLEVPGVVPVRSIHDVDWDAPIVHYVPARLDEDEYEEAFTGLWESPEVERVLHLDECAGPTSQNRCPQGLLLWIQQGDQMGRGLLACSQRPVAIAAPLRTESEHVIIFVPPTTKRDLTTLGGDIGFEEQQLRDELQWLADNEGLYSHLWYCRETHELRPCAPLAALQA